jgi:hypothetical protein
MTKDEAIHKALKVLNCLNNDRVYETAWVKGAINACEKALEIANCDLKQPAQEPVAYMYADEKTAHVLWKRDKCPPETIPLYTHPHQWQKLTDDEIRAIDDITLRDYYVEKQATEFARAIEQTLKEKNT